MDSSVSPKDEIWFLRVCHHISNAVYYTGLSFADNNYSRGHIIFRSVNTDPSSSSSHHYHHHHNVKIEPAEWLLGGTLQVIRGGHLDRRRIPSNLFNFIFLVKIFSKSVSSILAHAVYDIGFILRISTTHIIVFKLLHRQDRQCSINLIFRGVRVTIVVVEKQ